jgi:hypothetical protein
MTIVTHILSHSLVYAAIVDGSLLLMMVALSPRIWGYADYPQAIKDKVPPQTKRERRVAAILAVPWMLFVVGFPIYSTYALKAGLGGEIPFGIAFLNVFAQSLLTVLGDLVILDWLIVSRLTPRFVIIPGTTAADYKDFSHHFKGHAKAAPALLLLCLAVAGIVWYF